MTQFLTAYLWVALVYVLAYLIWIGWASWAEGMPWRKFADLEGELRKLLRRGYDRGSLHVRTAKFDRVFSFEKYIVAKGNYGLKLYFPLSNTSPDVPRPLEDFCGRHGIHSCEQAEAGKNFVVDCGRDLDVALELARLVWRDCLGFSEEGKIELDLVGFSPSLGLVDNPNHPRLSPREQTTIYWRRHERHVRKTYDLSIIGFIMWAAVPTLCFIALLVVLPVVVLLSLGGAPDWSIAAGGLTLSGSTLSLLVLLAYVAAFGAFRVARKRLKVPEWQWAPGEKAVARGLWTIELTLPVAVVLIWAGL